MLCVVQFRLTLPHLLRNCSDQVVSLENHTKYRYSRSAAVSLFEYQLLEGIMGGHHTSCYSLDLPSHFVFCCPFFIIVYCTLMSNYAPY